MQLISPLTSNYNELYVYIFLSLLVFVVYKLLIILPANSDVPIHSIVLHVYPTCENCACRTSRTKSIVDEGLGTYDVLRHQKKEFISYAFKNIGLFLRYS